MCYQKETVWAAGNRYVKRRNWAVYFAYPEMHAPRVCPRCPPPHPRAG